MYVSVEVTSKKEVHFLDTTLATSNVSLHAYNMIATSKQTLLAEEGGLPQKKIVVYVDSTEPGAMAALPAQPKLALFQDTRIRPGRLEPSTLRWARSWAFCFFSIWPKSTFLCLSHILAALLTLHSVLFSRSFVDAHCSFKKKYNT